MGGQPFGNNLLLLMLTLDLGLEIKLSNCRTKTCVSNEHILLCDCVVVFVIQGFKHTSG